jgi:hypothetical protein
VPLTTSGTAATALFACGLFCAGFQISGIDVTMVDLYEDNVYGDRCVLLEDAISDSHLLQAEAIQP